MSEGDVRWLLSRGKQYALTHASYLAGRAFCGPVLGTLVTNYRCNYACRMCDLHLRDREFRERGLEEFGTPQMKQLLKDFRGLGVSGIGFTGGEPLLRKDIFELLAYTKELGMISHLNTNGFFLDERNAGRVLEARVDSVNISLDGARPGTHDAIRGHKGAFERAVEAAGRLNALRKKRGASVRIKTVAVLQEENIGEVAGIVSLAADLGVDCVEFIPRQPFTSSSEGQIVPPAFLQKVDEAVDFLLGPAPKAVRIENSPSHIRLFRRSFRNEPSPVRCYAGYNSYAVDCYGEVYPCVPWYNWRRAAGNVRERDLASLWYSAEYGKVRAEIRRCGGCYLNCQAELNILFNPFGAHGAKKR